MEIIWSCRYDHGLNIGHQIRYYILYCRTIYFSGPFTSFFKSNQWYIIYDIKNIVNWPRFYIKHQVLSGPYCVFNSVFLHWPHNIWLILYEAYTNMPEITCISCHIQYQYQVLGCETGWHVGRPECWPIACWVESKWLRIIVCFNQFKINTLFLFSLNLNSSHK